MRLFAPILVVLLATNAWAQPGTFPGSGSGGATTLNALTDVTLTTPNDAAILIYDTGTSQWRDADMSGDCTMGDTGVIDCVAGGSAIILDIGDDGGNDSIALGEVATNADANAIVTEPSADKMLIDMSKDWPKADTADDLTCTNCIGPTEITDLTLGTDTAGSYALGDAEGGAATTGDSATAFFSTGEIEDARVTNALTVAAGTIGTSDITLKQGETPTSEGNIEWDSATDTIRIGSGGGTSIFYGGPTSGVNTALGVDTVTHFYLWQGGAEKGFLEYRHEGHSVDPNTVRMGCTSADCGLQLRVGENAMAMSCDGSARCEFSGSTLTIDPVTDSVQVNGNDVCTTSGAGCPGFGLGDMLKIIYDIDVDGVVDDSETTDALKVGTLNCTAQAAGYTRIVAGVPTICVSGS